MSLERRPEVEVLAGRRTIVTALPLKDAARERLAELLDARVVDIREPVDDADIVLTPACSPQLIDALADRFDGARVVVVELDDWELGIESSGPVKRILRAGAAAYLLADGIDELAAKLGTPDRAADDDEPPTVGELSASSTIDEVIAAFLRESVEYSTPPPTDDR